MNKKIIIIAVIAILVLGLVAYAIILNSQNTTVNSSTTSKTASNPAPIQNTSSQNCNFAKDVVRNSLFITIGSLGSIDQLKISVQTAIDNIQGTVASLNDATYDGIRSVQISGSVPQNKFKAFTSTMMELGKSPNAIENQSINTENYDSIMQGCQGMSKQLAFLYEQKKSYQNQSTLEESFQEKQDTINKLNDINQQIIGLEQGLIQVTQNLNAAVINISITNGGIGG